MPAMSEKPITALTCVGQPPARVSALTGDALDVGFAIGHAEAARPSRRTYVLRGQQAHGNDRILR
jgi:hypothetical protein